MNKKYGNKFFRIAIGISMLAILVSSAGARTSQNITYVNYDDSGFTGSSWPSANIFSTSIKEGPVPTSSATASVTYNGMNFTPLKKVDLSAATLANYDTLILYQVCDIGTIFNPVQLNAINDYLANGNKILLFDGDRCAVESGGKGIADYSWFKYPFTTSAPGPRAATGKLTVVESSTLTNGLESDPFTSDELGDANTAITHDCNWFAAAATNNTLGNYGYFLAYARDTSKATPQGLIIYNGADYWYTIGPTDSLTHMFLNMLNQKFNDEDILPSKVPLCLSDFKQNRNRDGSPVIWADEPLFGIPNNSNMSDNGSEITSLADVLASYNKTLVVGLPPDPHGVNTNFKSKGGFDSASNTINWENAQKPTILNFSLGSHDFSAVPIATRIQHIDDALIAKNLVIAGIKGTFDGHHYVVFYQKSLTNAPDGSPDYLIADPYRYPPYATGDRSGMNLSQAYGKSIMEMADTLDVIVIKNEAPKPGGSWVIVGHSPIQMLITDPSGAQTGFDPTTNSTVQNIPGSSYGVQQIINDIGINPQPPGVLYFGLSTAVNGTYRVQVIGTGSGPYTLDFSSVSSSGHSSQQIITGTAATGKIDIYIVTVQDGQLTDIQRVPGTISGIKFEDINGNGIKDSGELGLADWTIALTNETGSIVTAITNATGNYSFTNLTDGNYTVGEVLQTGWIQTAPAVSTTGSATYTVNIAGSSNIVDKDFGNFHKGNITGGGWINIIGDPKATFGIVGQYPENSNAARGNVEYQDHAAKLNIKSVKINTVATTLDKKKGAITGLAQVNGAGSYPFEVYVEDNGEPGKGKDVFKISLPTYPYSNGAILSSGNLQIHS